MAGRIVRWRVVASPTVLALLMCCPCAWGASSDSARKLVRESGVAGGLVVHAGCQDADWTAALRVNQRYLVQGLQRDPAGVARARARLRDRKLLGPVTVLGFAGREPGSLTFCGREGSPRGWSGGQAGEDFTCRLGVLLVPQGVVPRHGLSPVSHHEVGIQLLGGMKRLACLRILEAVKQGQPQQERRLGLGRAGVGELHVADSLSARLGKRVGRCPDR